MIYNLKKYFLSALLIILFSIFSYSNNCIAAIYFIDKQLGVDINTGTSPDTAWKSLNKINNSRFKPGDEILFKRNQKWRGTLIVNHSGNSDNPITYSSYGDDGANPVIMRTVEFTDWKLTHEKNKNGKVIKIWSGKIKNLRNSWGMVKDGLRAESFKQYSGKNFKSLPNGYYYAPLNKGIFYLRNDAGNPGNVEIGAQESAILIRDQNYIIIDSIDSFGPGGRHDSGSSTGFKSIDITGNSRHIKIKNNTISHSNSTGISANFNTSDISYYNVTSHNNASTGIYMNSNGGEILNCKAYDNGRLVTDKGDRGGIGSYKGSNILIRNNEVYHNGPDIGYADFEISMVGTGSIIIEKNYIHDCIQGCLQIAEGGDNSTIAYNIISIYGTAKGKGPSSGIYSGIRIGAGGSDIGGAKNVRIINNIIHGGQQPAESKEAGLYVGWYDSSNLIVKNNIFSHNINKNIYVRGKAKLDGSSFSNNLYSKNDSGSDSNIGINFKERDIASLQQWQKKGPYGKGSIVAPSLFVNHNNFNSPSDFKLQTTSKALESGVPVDQNSDFNDSAIAKKKSPDIGAFEHKLK